MANRFYTALLTGILGLTSLVGPARSDGVIVYDTNGKAVGVRCSCESKLENTAQSGSSQASQTQIQSAKPQESKKGRFEVPDFANDSDSVLLARMLFGEARNCSFNEKVAIAYTALDRANDRKKWNGTTVREAILCPWQYSCLNQSDPNRIKLKNPEKYDTNAWQECLNVAEGVLAGKYENPVKGATHYHTRNISPKWASSSSMIDLPEPKEFKHNFYKEK